jgi:hypothetical protein
MVLLAAHSDLRTRTNDKKTIPSFVDSLKHSTASCTFNILVDRSLNIYILATSSGVPS